MLLLTGRLKQFYVLRINKLTANRFIIYVFSSELKLSDNSRIELEFYFMRHFFQISGTPENDFTLFFAIYFIFLVGRQHQSIT